MAARKCTFTRAEIALALELYYDNCSWKAIARGLGCTENGIKNAVYRAIRTDHEKL